MDGYILVIDYNPDIKDATQQEWAKYGYELLWVNDFAEAAMKLRRGDVQFSLIALTSDHLGQSLIPTLMLLREITAIPIIILSTEYDASTKVEAIALGADEYLCIPETLTEGVLSGYALIRRYMQLGQNGDDKPPLIIPGNLVVHPEPRRVFYKGREVRMPRKTFDLLYFLAKNENRVLTYENIYDVVWGDVYNEDICRNQISCAVTKLRQILRSISPTPEYIVAERYIGYRFVTKHVK